jgi:hypothetical protein
MFHCLSSCFTRPHLTALQFNDAFFARPASHRLPKFKTPALRELMHLKKPLDILYIEYNVRNHESREIV